MVSMGSFFILYKNINLHNHHCEKIKVFLTSIRLNEFTWYELFHKSMEKVLWDKG
jgi:hypothetical protein